MDFKHVFRKDVYESSSDEPIYIIVEGVGESQKIKIEYRNGKEIPEVVRQLCMEHFHSSQNQDELISALKAVVNGLPEEYDDLHTKNLIERCKNAIKNNT